MKNAKTAGTSNYIITGDLKNIITANLSPLRSDDKPGPISTGNQSVRRHFRLP
jgi:hypothetical protein